MNPAQSDVHRSAPRASIANRSVRNVFLLAVFLIVVGALHWSKTDPLYLFCEDVGAEYIPKIHHAYRHPWDTFRNAPTPEYIYGSANAGLEGAISAPATVPFIPALLAKIAPSGVADLMRFEWRLTGLFVLGSMFALYGFLRRIGLDRLIAVAAALFYPFSGPVFAEWRHVAPMRGRLMLPLLCWALLAFFERPSYRNAVLAALAIVLCLSQSFQLYWIVPMTALWAVVVLYTRRERIIHLLRRDPRVVGKTIGAAIVAAAIVVAVFGVPWVRGSADFTGSVSLEALSAPKHFFSYMYLGVGALDPSDNFFLHPDLHSMLLPFDSSTSVGVVVLSGLFLAIGTAIARFMHREPPNSNARLPRIGWALFAVGFALGFVSHLPREWLFSARDNAVYLRGLPIHAPALVALLFHVTRRTWLLMASLGEVIVAATALQAFCSRSLTDGDRLRCMGYGVSAYIASLGLSSLCASRRDDAMEHVEAVAVVIAALLCVYLFTVGSARLRWLGGVALALFSATAALQVTSLNYDGTIRIHDDGRLRLSRAEAVLERFPARAQHQYEYRVANLDEVLSRNNCFLIEAACDNSYPIKHLPSIAGRFFTDIDGYRELNAPYFVNFNYRRLTETGLASFLGLRHIVLQGRASNLRRGMRYLKGTPTELYHDRELTTWYFEDTTAYPKSWPTRDVVIVQSFSDAIAEVLKLGPGGGLRDTAIVFESDGARVPMSAVHAEEGTVRVLHVEPGHIELETTGTQAMVVPTNEFFVTAWRVTVDGVASQPITVDAAFLGAVVPPGQHRVVFTR